MFDRPPPQTHGQNRGRGRGQRSEQGRARVSTAIQPQENIILTPTVSHSHDFKAGRLVHYIDKWRDITSDPAILNMVTGCSIDFMNSPVQTSCRETRLNEAESKILDREIQLLLDNGVLECAAHCEVNTFLPYFLTPKKDGTYRMILNLKLLNQSIEYVHFKMERLQSAMRLMTEKCLWHN